MCYVVLIDGILAILCREVGEPLPDIVTEVLASGDTKQSAWLAFLSREAADTPVIHNGRPA